MGLYDNAEAYQLAFSYRSFAAEVNAICSWYRAQKSADPEGVLELAAGPADHAIEFGKRGIPVAALDNSADMLGFAMKQAFSSRVPLEVIDADMTAFETARKYDLALLMLDSAAHILNWDNFVLHLNSVAESLTSDGFYLLEMTHPAEFFGAPSPTLSRWQMSRDDMVVDFEWSTERELDPITQIYTARVTLDVDRGGESVTVIRDAFEQRLWTATELVAAVSLSGRFDVIAQYGAMDLRTPLSDRDAWRMISILHKKE